MARKGIFLKHGNTGVIRLQEPKDAPSQEDEQRHERRRLLMAKIIDEHKEAFDELSKY
ncbi:MAG: hypothetical protein GX256_03030 [Fretibacterium sp.]|nr:hypothetical protein [Fretibacterium sp.]